ncbi:DUF934 domain-containing protein [Methylomonas paludis]|uniref:DUF934 domain-containing protein n=1 Tax=Methylomonas paludis TaxID=1173101 RepID=A0A975MP44_9GAMM|nr:DUF934 domain-containing protein [Methylomonas paludis]QWF70931.1 DUF934 domain-containing protein [Methylomonas paludis]
MQIIKDKQIVENQWTFIDDDSEIGADAGNISVSLQRWQNQSQSLLDRAGKIGVRLLPADNIDDLANHLDQLALIELNFPVFTDGRLFSLARLLRSKYGFQGEIRAVGHYLPDQVYFLSRVGVNAFALENQSQIPLVLTSLADFSVNYQLSSQ